MFICLYNTACIDADVIAEGMEDGPTLEKAVLELKSSPLVKSVERIADAALDFMPRYGASPCLHSIS